MSIQNIPDNRQDRSLGELFADLMRETTTLIRQEVALAKSEMSQKAVSIGKDIGFLAAGGAVAYAGLLAIVAAIILGTDLGWTARLGFGAARWRGRCGYRRGSRHDGPQRLQTPRCRAATDD